MYIHISPTFQTQIKMPRKLTCRQCVENGCPGTTIKSFLRNLYFFAIGGIEKSTSLFSPKNYKT